MTLGLRVARALSRTVGAGWPGCAVALGLLAIPGTATAATVAVQPDRDSPEIYDEVSYIAADGERNRLVVSWPRQEPYGPQAVFVLTDPGAVLTPGASCASVDEHTVRCTPRTSEAGEQRGVETVDVELRDLDDEYSFMAPAGTEGPRGSTHVSGGPGNDRLTSTGQVSVLDGDDGDDHLVGGPGEEDQLNGGPGDDELLGGEGRDMMDGGGGRDRLFGQGGADSLTDGDRDGAPGDGRPGPDLLDGGRERTLDGTTDRVVYDQRTAPVFVDLARSGTGGERGEGDRLVDFESAVGGRGGDRLAGDSGPNVLAGGPGRDRLTGRDGDDEFVPGTGQGVISCGDGKSDRVLEPRSNHYLTPDCDWVFYGDDEFRANPMRRTQGQLSFLVTCPSADEDSDNLYTVCSGTVVFREATGRRRLLARAPFSRGRQRAVRIRWTPIGRRLSARRSGVRATVRIVRRASEPTPVRGWTLRLRAPN